MMEGIPNTTYRLQLHRGFTLRDATALIPYLAALGVSHVYCSPYLHARAGSTHGYDIVDHSRLNPEIGQCRDLEDFVATLREYRMGQILDIVPNHMGVGGDDNAWWLNLLEHGPASPWADFFDIDWSPPKESLHGRLLLPLLGEHYGNVLEKGELRLILDPAHGEFYLRYFQHRFPLDPRSYPVLLEGASGEYPELDALARAFAALPARSELSEAARQTRQQESMHLKQRLAVHCRKEGYAVALQAVVDRFNGRCGEPASFDALHELLEQQVYRLAYWQVAVDEINYRRFFDINELAGLRSERVEVFQHTHQLVLALFRDGLLDGLRIDHPDGLNDPQAYLLHLRRAIATVSPAHCECYLVVEKITAENEQLPADWPVHGTTGYDFAALIGGLFLYPDGERPLTRLYHRFIAQQVNFDELLYQRKKITMHRQLAGELTVLANLLSRIAEADRHTRDFTLHGLRDTLLEVIACFPVYRTYVSLRGASEEDRRIIEQAVAQACKRNPTVDASLFDFLRAVMLTELPGDEAHRALVQSVAMKLQQYTAPVMAKALEDNVCYLYNRLLCLNEVGALPGRFGIDMATFHHANRQRRDNWPGAMLNSSTHDSKRGEDARARLQVLSEIPQRWRSHVTHWSRLNRRHKRKCNGSRCPSRNDEYLLYQTLLATWPLAGPRQAQPDWATYRQRIGDYLRKAVREAKVASSWSHPDPDYESALDHFIGKLLANEHPNPFIDNIRELVASIAPYGLYNALSQVLLKLTCPGMPDLYQGSELWHFTLVDPDNRRAVDYAVRGTLLAALQQREQDKTALCAELLDTLHDGRIKLYLTWQTLQLRRRHERLFREGDYLPLVVSGARADHVCAFARCHGKQIAVVIAPRWYATLLDSKPVLPLGPEVWGDTRVHLPPVAARQSFHELFSGRPVHTAEGGSVALGNVLSHFPLALLSSEHQDN